MDDDYGFILMTVIGMILVILVWVGTGKLCEETSNQYTYQDYVTDQAIKSSDDLVNYILILQ